MLDSVIELVIAEGNDIIAESIDQPDLKHSPESRVIRGPLIEIPGVEKKEIPPSDGISDAVHKRSPLDYASPAGRFPGTFRLKMTVRVIEMHNRELLGRSSGTGNKHSRHNGSNQLSHNQSTITTLPSLEYSMFFPAAVKDFT